MEITNGQRLRRLVASAFLIIFTPSWVAWTWIVVDLILAIIASSTAYGKRDSLNSWWDFVLWILLGIVLLLGLNVLQHYVQ